MGAPQAPAPTPLTAVEEPRAPRDLLMKLDELEAENRELSDRVERASLMTEKRGTKHEHDYHMLHVQNLQRKNLMLQQQLFSLQQAVTMSLSSRLDAMQNAAARRPPVINVKVPTQNNADDRLVRSVETLADKQAQLESEMTGMDDESGNTQSLRMKHSANHHRAPSGGPADLEAAAARAAQLQSLAEQRDAELRTREHLLQQRMQQEAAVAAQQQGPDPRLVACSSARW